jgi:hypothetical protein
VSGSVDLPPTTTEPKPARRARLADGCRHVYLDVGTNMGVQIRKIHEFSFFNSTVDAETGKRYVDFFDSNLKRSAAELWYTHYFGPPHLREHGEVCSFGFEPNPKHASWLGSLQKCYQARGWPLTVFTSTAAR